MDNGVAALMVRSRAAETPLFEFVESSTCTLGLNVTNLTAALADAGEHVPSHDDGATVLLERLQHTLEVQVICTPNQIGALGDGCVTKADMHVELLIAVLEEAEKALSPFKAFCETHPTGPIAAACTILLPYLNNTALLQEFYNEVAWAEHIAPMIPNITACPVATAQTTRWLAVSRQANATLAESVPECTVAVVSLDALAAESLTVPPVSLGSGLAVNASVVLPPGSLWQLFAAQVATPDGQTALNEFQLHDCDGGRPIGGPLDARVKAFSNALRDYVDDAQGTGLDVQASSKYLLLAATQKGVDQTMNLSAMTLPVVRLIHFSLWSRHHPVCSCPSPRHPSVDQCALPEEHLYRMLVDALRPMLCPNTGFRPSASWCSW